MIKTTLFDWKNYYVTSFFNIQFSLGQINGIKHSVYIILTIGILIVLWGICKYFAWVLAWDKMITGTHCNFSVTSRGRMHYIYHLFSSKTRGKDKTFNIQIYLHWQKTCTVILKFQSLPKQPLFIIFVEVSMILCWDPQNLP